MIGTWRRKPRPSGGEALDATSFEPAASETGRLGSWALFILLHVPLALLARQSAAVSTAAALLAGLAGLLFALDHRRPVRAAIAAAYIAGADVFWRMTGAEVAWEFGKYALAAMFLVSMLTQRPAPRLGSWLAYFVLLLPSTALTLWNAPGIYARAQIDFYLSGPLALAAGLWFFAGKSFRLGEIQRMFLALLAPIVAVLTLAGAGLLQSGGVLFSIFDSNVQASGGYRPNQVSLSLGLAALVCFLSLLTLRPPLLGKLALGALMLAMLFQSALTFSRGGIYIAGLAALAGVLMGLRDPRLRRAALAIFGATALVSVLFLLPQLQRITQNALAARFADVGASGRFGLSRAEVFIWLDNPLLGVGPGMATVARSRAIESPTMLPSHNELTRMPAEHGLPGLAGVVILIYAAWRSLRRAGSPEARTLVAALLVWVFGSLVYTAFRTAAPAFLFGLATACLELGAGRGCDRIFPPLENTLAWNRSSEAPPKM